jgi:tellurite resistance protein TerC
LLQDALTRFRYLHLGLAAILGDVAAKLVLTDVWHPIVVSLTVVIGALILAATASCVIAPSPRPRQHRWRPTRGARSGDAA